MNVWRYLLFFAGQVGMMSLARFFFQWISKFTTGSEGSAELLGGVGMVIVLFGFRAFDGITDPIAGSVSNWWIRKGRPRQQLQWFSFLVPGVGLILTFLPHEGMPVPLRWTCAIAGMFVFFVGYTFYAIPYWSLVGDYSNGDPGRRRILSNLLGGGMVAATGIGFVLSGGVIKAVGYAPAAVIFAIGGSILMTLPYFAAPPDSRDPKEKSPPIPFWKAAGIALRHRRFLALMALFAGSQMSFTIMTAASPFIAEDLLGGDEGDIARVMGPLLATAIPCFFLVPWVSRKIGWLKGMLFASLALAVVYCATSALGQALIGDAFFTAALLFALGGPMIALLLGLEAEGVVDCAEESGGGDLIGIYWGVFNFVIKILNGLALALAKWLGSLTKADAWGTGAVRAMSISAGACLFLGVLLYFVIKPHRGAESGSSGAH